MNYNKSIKTLKRRRRLNPRRRAEGKTEMIKTLYNYVHCFFSLIELLVVISIISVLVALLLPALKKAKDVTLSTQCKSNMRQCGIALHGYAGDFNDWLPGSECQSAYCDSNRELATLMMNFGYAPINTLSHVTSPYFVHFGQIYQCPALPPPQNYKFGNFTMPHLGWESRTEQSYGTRTFFLNYSYPGEKHTATVAEPKKRFIKMRTLYKPSECPYMVDTATDVNTPDNSAIAGPIQRFIWTPSSSTVNALHLRHNKKGNIWCPDGHVDAWTAIEAANWMAPNGDPGGYRY